MSDIFGGDDSPPAPPNIPPPPPPIPPTDIIDEFAGLQVIETVNADGKKVRKIMELPRTQEEMAILGPARDLVKKALDNVLRVVQEDNRAAQYFAPFIETWANINDQRVEAMGRVLNIPDIENKIMQVRNVNEGNLQNQYETTKNDFIAKMRERGLNGSSFEQSMLNQLDSSFIQAKNQNEVFASEWGQKYMGNALNLAQQQYAMEDQPRQAQLQRAAAEYEGNVANDQNNLQQQMAAMQMGNQMVAQDIAKKQGAALPQMMNQQVGIDNQVQMNHYNAGVAAQQANYANQMQHYNAQQAQGDGLGAGLLKLGTGLAFSALMGPGGMAAGGIMGAMGGGGGGRVNYFAGPSIGYRQPGVIYGGW